MQKKSWFFVPIASLTTLVILGFNINAGNAGQQLDRNILFDTLSNTLRNTSSNGLDHLPPEERSILLISSRQDGRLLELTNQQRANNGVAALRLSAQLGRAAQSHAEDMANRNFFSHTGSNGSSMSDRVNQAGYSWQAVGENIYMGTSATPRQAVTGWMNSPGHRRNILNSNYTEIGFGVASRGRDVYYVQVFGRPR
jgi:uncharacterized protein YkwD